MESTLASRLRWITDIGQASGKLQPKKSFFNVTACFLNDPPNKKRFFNYDFSSVIYLPFKWCSFELTKRFTLQGALNGRSTRIHSDPLGSIEIHSEDRPLRQNQTGQPE